MGNIVDVKWDRKIKLKKVKSDLIQNVYKMKFYNIIQTNEVLLVAA